MTSAATLKPIQIFKPGRHTAMGGQSLAFGESDLQATVAAYDPKLHEAPICIGHPKHDLPAYGWISGLAFADGGIDAMPHQVDAAFAEQVGAGAYKKVSAAFYSPSAPGNPVPGVWYLRHVAFLGAQPPAVKGLRSPAFADAEEGVVEFSEWDDMTNAGLWRNLREWILGKFGAEEADKVLPGYEVRALELGAQDEINRAREVREAAPTPAAVPAFADPQPETSVTPEQAAALEAENQRLRAQIAEAATRQRHDANVAFAETLVAEGRMLPASRDVFVATLDHLGLSAEGAEFGEGDGKQPLADAFRAALQSLPKVVEFGEHATTARAAGAAEGTVAFAAPDGYAVDTSALARHQRALAHQAANPGCSYVDAVAAVA